MTRGDLFHILIHHQQKAVLHKYGNSRNFHSTILSGNGKQGDNINVDELPSDWQEVHAKRRNIITFVDPAEEKRSMIEDLKSVQRLKKMRRIIMLS